MKNQQDKLKEKLLYKRSINQYTKDGVFVKKWNKLEDASKCLGIKKELIMRVCRKKRKYTGGYIFEYSKFWLLLFIIV